MGKLIRYRSAPGILFNTPEKGDSMSLVSVAYTTLDGEIGRIIPMSGAQRQGRRLWLLYRKMVYALCSFGGLHPIDHRSAKCVQRAHIQSNKYVLDGTWVLIKFNSLSRSKQNMLAKSIGTTVEKIYSDLVSLVQAMDLS